jgi:translocator protein
MDARRWIALVGFLVVSFAAGAIGSTLQGPVADVVATYEGFDLPAWAPPSSVFGIVWPILYLMIGVAAWVVWLAAGSLRAAAGTLGLWVVQLAVNAAWPAVFFGGDDVGLGLVVIVVLDLLVIATIAAFRWYATLAAWLMAPYLVWLLYATALNASIWWSQTFG